METVRSVRAVIQPVPAAASALLQPLLLGPPRSCPVVAASRTALHATTSDQDVPVLSIVASGGARLPGACVLASPHAFLVDHDQLVVGGGTVELAGVSVRVSRWWTQPAVTMPTTGVELRAGAEAMIDAITSAAWKIAPEIVEPVARLAAAVATDRITAIEVAVNAMVGLGPGLTPAADDVLVGALLCWHHLSLAGWTSAGSTGSIVAAAVRQRLAHTSTVSASLLQHAMRGTGVPEALQVLDALRTPVQLAPVVHDLQLVGHDTGPSMVLGIEVALGAVLGARRPERVAR
jgi:hypothetical protein